MDLLQPGDPRRHQVKFLDSIRGRRPRPVAASGATAIVLPAPSGSAGAPSPECGIVLSQLPDLAGRATGLAPVAVRSDVAPGSGGGEPLRP